MELLRQLLVDRPVSHSVAILECVTAALAEQAAAEAEPILVH